MTASNSPSPTDKSSRRIIGSPEWQAEQNKAREERFSALFWKYVDPSQTNDMEKELVLYLMEQAVEQERASRPSLGTPKDWRDEMIDDLRRSKMPVASAKLSALNAVLHKELLDSGLVTVAQWNQSIAPALAAIGVAINTTPPSPLAAPIPMLPEAGAVYVALGIESEVKPAQVDAVMRAATKLFRKNYRASPSHIEPINAASESGRAGSSATRTPECSGAAPSSIVESGPLSGLREAIEKLDKERDGGWSSDAVVQFHRIKTFAGMLSAVSAMVPSSGWRKMDNEESPNAIHITRVMHDKTTKHEFIALRDGEFYAYTVEVPPLAPTETAAHRRIAAEATGDFYCKSEQVRMDLKCQKPCDKCWFAFAGTGKHNAD